MEPFERAYRRMKVAWWLMTAAWAVSIAACWGAILGGCVTARDMAGIRADIDTVAGQVNELGLTVGDVTLQGGQGDSITMWILAAGAAIVYPIVWRPIRKRIERKG